MKPGTIIERYEVERLIGQGGMASVYEVKHLHLGTHHALKVLKSDRATVADALLREGRLQAQLDPTLVIPVTDVLFLDGVPALVMPLVRGCSLREVLTAYRPQPAEAAALVIAMARAVAHAHEVGIVHRDIKPANVLLDEKFGRLRVRVADFGLARSASDRSGTAPGIMMGTPAYAPLEQLTDASSADASSDLWSMGVVIYELLAGFRPFPHQDFGELLRVLFDEEVDFRPIPAEWRPLLQSLLQKEQAKRGPSMADIPAAVESIVAPIDLSSDSGVRAVMRKIRDGRAGANNAEPFLSLSDAAHTISIHAEVSSEAPTQLIEARGLHVEVQTLPGLVGRNRQLSELEEAFRSGFSVVQLIGKAGSGTSRVATQFASRCADRWRGGIHYIDLSHGNTRQEKLVEIAAHFGLLAQGPPTITSLGQALAALGDCLLILDRADHCTLDFEPTIGKWREMAPKVNFLIVGRTALDLASDLRIALPPMDDDAALDLFVQHIPSRRGAYTPSADERHAIEKICSRLDNCPVPILLTAANVSVHSPRGLLQQLQDAVNHLDQANGTDEFEAKVRGILEWAWRRLPSWERAALAQASVFEGGFDLEAAEAVLRLPHEDEAHWVVPALDALLTKSWLKVTGDGRFDMSGSVQSFAIEQLAKLGQQEDAFARHRTYYAALDTLQQTETDSLSSVVRLEVDNLLAIQHHYPREKRSSGLTSLPGSMVSKLINPTLLRRVEHAREP